LTIRLRTQTKKPGISLIELIVTLGILSVVMVGAALIFQEGMQLFRTHQATADSQIAALKALSKITTEVVNATPDLAKSYNTASGSPPGIVFASPIMDSGGARFDDFTGQIYWQKWVCYYFEPDPSGGDDGKIFRAEEDIPDESPPNPGHRDTLDYVKNFVTTHDTGYFQASGASQRRLVADGISGFEVDVYTGAIGGAGSAEKVAFDLTVEAGNKSKSLRNGFYIKVGSKVTPRG
jgi:type II secretory pathway pseudopilin PulG